MSCATVHVKVPTPVRMARVLVWLSLAILFTSVGAVSVGAQGLTDGATHPPPSTGPMPYSPPGTWLPGTPGFPQLGQSFVDPVFGTTIRRITNDFPGQSFSDIYATNGWWNADGTRFYHRRSTGWVIVDTATGAFVRTGVPGAADGFVQFDPVSPDVYYYVSGVNLRQYNITTGTDTVVKTFPATLGSTGASSNAVDRTGRYFLVYYSGALHVWNKVTNTIYGGAITVTVGAGTADMSPDGNYVVVAGSGGFRSYPIDHTAQTLSTTGTLFWTLCGDHHALGSASDGKTYMLTANCFDEGSIYHVDITLPQTAGNVQQQKNQNVRMFFTDGQHDAEHFTCAGKGLNQDWCAVSIESIDDSFTDPGLWRPYKQEIVMVLMVPPYTVRRIAHHRSRDVDTNYYHSPRLSMSWDGTKIAWASNMGYDAGVGVGYSDIYIAELNVNAPAPVIGSLTPDTAAAGSPDFVLTVNGSNFVPRSALQWNGANRATTYVSATQLKMTVTAADLAVAGTASVRVVTAAPGGGTSGALTFTIDAAPNPPPTLTSLAPSSVTAGAAGFTLTVNGTNFVGGSVVEWNGTPRATTFVSSTQLRAVILAADVATAGTAAVTVDSPAPGGGTSNALTFTINAAPNPVPSVTSLSPTNANAGGAAFTLVVNGTNFVAASVVQWNGTARPTTFVSAIRLRASITAADLATAGTAAVRVFTPAPGGGTSNALTFTINIPPNAVPTVSSLSPTGTTAGGPGFTLVVNGTNFVATSVVDWNGSPRATTFVSATQLQAVVLGTDVAAAGSAAVTVFSPTPGGGTSNAATFTINTAPNPVPTVASLSPSSVSSGSAAFTLTVDGTSFVAGAVVQWNGAARTTTFVSSTQVRAAIAAADVAGVGIAQVTVSNPAPGGGVSNAVTLAVNDTKAPTVSITAPTTGTTVSDSVTVTATAGDNTGVVGVQLKLDGVNLGSELTIAPYSLVWDTTSVPDGSHTLTAVARDAASLTTTSATVTITVINTVMLTVAEAGTGSGAVTSNPAGITCPGTCSQSYRINTVVALSAAPAARSFFGGWSGDTDCSTGRVTMSRAKRCTATFTAMPDVTVTGLSGPATGATGTTISVSNTVANLGPGVAGAFRITFYMSATDPTPGAGTTVGFRDVAGLAAGASSIASTTVTIPAAFTAGPYHLSAVADSAGVLTEVDETNNGRTAAATINVALFRPDVVMTVMTAPASGAIGRPLTLTNTVRNQGPAPAGAFRITFYMSVTDATPGAGTAIGFRDVTALAAGASSTAATVVTVPATLTPGAYHVSAVADSGNAVVELDDTNNGLTASTLVTVTLYQPDIVMLAVTGPASGATGQPLTVSSTVRNQGPAPAGAFRITFYMSPTDPTPGAGTAVGFRDVAALAAAATSTAATVVTVPIGFAAGPYYLSAVADSGAMQVELDETNNARTAPAVVNVALFRPDLTLTVLTAPATGAVGRPMTVANTVRNQGPAPAGAFRITFYMSATDPTPGAGTAVGFRDLGALAAGAASTASTVVTIPATFTPGLYYISALADSAGTQTELDESNNGLTGASQVMVTPYQPDLLMTAVAVPARGAVGRPLVVMNTVRNQGPAPATAFRVTFYMSATDPTPGAGVAVGFRDVMSLAPGASSTAATTVTVPVPPTLVPGRYYVSAVADGGGVQIELSESNNGLTASTQVTITLYQPDLVMSALSAPASGAIGRLVTVTHTVRNQGPAPAGPFWLMFYMSTDPTPGTGVPVWVYVVLGLAPDASSTASTQIMVPETLTPGSYYISAIADAGGISTELDETNNGLSTSTPMTVTYYQPDLVTTALTTALTGAVGRPTTVTTTVRNQGPAPAGAFRITFYMSATDTTPGAGVAVGFRDLAGLAPATSATVSTAVTIPATLTPGSYHVSAIADSGGAVAELVETNNGLTASTVMTVTPFQPDLVITALTAPATGATSRPITIANTVRNQGPAPAGPFRVTFYMSATDPTPGAGTAIGFRDIASLAAGASSVANTVVTIPATYPAGTYYVSALADSAGALTELVETNNGRTAPTTMAVALFQSDLVVTALSTPAASVIGRAMTVANTVRNQGIAPAGPFRVTFYMSATDPTPGAGTMIGFRDVVSLAAGATSAASTVVTIPTTYGVGTYFVSAMADSGGTVTELSDTNNGLTAVGQLTLTGSSPAAAAVPASAGADAAGTP